MILKWSVFPIVHRVGRRAIIGLAGFSALVDKLRARLRVLPAWLRPYLLTLTELAAVVAVVAVVLKAFGHQAAPFCTLLLVVDPVQLLLLVSILLLVSRLSSATHRTSTLLRWPGAR